MRTRTWLGFGILALAWAGTAGPQAHGQDSVFVVSGAPVRGEVVDSTITAVIVETEKGRSEVPIQNLKNIKFAGEPAEFEKAKRSFDAKKYDEGLAELDKITPPPAAKMVAAELEYLKAWGNAKSALNSGNTTAKNAGAIVSGFLKKSPETYHFFELTELLGHLLLAVGRNDLAETEFARLTDCPLPLYQLRGNFALGQAQLLAGKGAEAERSFDAVAGSGLNDDAAARIKSIAGCLRAKALLQQGRTDEARSIAEKIIQNEDPGQTELFAHAYNTLGLVHLSQGEDLPAVLAFLHTDLLFSNQAEAHAEALFHLAALWPKLDKNDRALETRTALKSLYRNSYWAGKLDQ